MEFKTKFQPDTEGVFLGVPSEIYHSAPGESNSSMAALSRSPLDYKRYKDGLVAREATEFMEYGQLFHSAVLENGSLKDLCYLQPELYADGTKPWHNGAKECKAWCEMHNDKPILSRREYEQLKAEVEYVKKHRAWASFLFGGHAEVSCFARDPATGLLLKGRLDCLRVIPNGGWLITDLKTTQDASTHGFSREILTRKYHVQAAHYRRLINLLDPGVPVLFAFIPVEKGRCIKVNPRYLARQAMDLGEKVLDANLEKIVSCRRTNRWPEWHDDTDQIEYIDLPDFVYQDTDSLSGMTAATNNE